MNGAVYFKSFAMLDWMHFNLVSTRLIEVIRRFAPVIGPSGWILTGQKRLSTDLKYICWISPQSSITIGRTID